MPAFTRRHSPPPVRRGRRRWILRRRARGVVSQIQNQTALVVRDIRQHVQEVIEITTRQAKLLLGLLTAYMALEVVRVIHELMTKIIVWLSK